MAAVTAGLAVYNGEKYLENAMAALSAQTFRDLRILVSDNCSTDSTPDILARWAKRDPRIDIHRQKENIGPVRNFRYVMETAQSPWFMMCAHDDRWTPNFVEELYANAQKTPGTQLSVPKVVQVRENPLPGQDPHDPRPFFEPAGAARGVARARLLMRHVRAGWFYALFEREALLSAQAEARAFGHVWAHDYILLLPFLLNGRVVGSNEAVFYQMATTSSIEKYRPKTARDQYILYRDFLASMKRIVARAPLSAAEKALLAPDLLLYSRHGGKIRRMLKYRLREALAA